jgi:hypothetical protein
MKTLRTATTEDFKIGTTLIAKSGGWEFTLRRKYDEGIWECKDKVHFESEAKHYNVKS